MDAGASLISKIDPSLKTRLEKDVFIFDSIAKIPAHVNLKQSTFIAQNLAAQDLIDLADKTGLRHVVQNTKSKFLREVNLSSRFMKTPDTIFKDAARVILNDETLAAPLELSFRHSKGRDETLAPIMNYLKKIPGGEMHRDSVRILADELFTNALYNAPTNTRGERPNAQLSRTVAVELEGAQTAKIMIAHDHQRLFLACEDPFGSLEENKFISGLNSKYGDDALAPVNMGPGGAGIGCRLLFDRSSELFIVCQKGMRTFFGCCMLLGLSARDLERTNKNLHLFFF